MRCLDVLVETTHPAPSIMKHIGSKKHFFKVLVVFSIALTVSHQVPLFTRLLSLKGGANEEESWQSYNNTAVVTTWAMMKEDNPAQLLFHQYKEQHSSQVLLQEWNDIQHNFAKNNSTMSAHQSLNGRKFAVAYYSCPLQAGNRLHHFFNSLVWSIVTNRTLLYQYFDFPTCLRITKNWNICNSSNTVNECDEVLHRNSWIPSFVDWKTKLQFQNMTSFSFWSTIEKRPNHRLWQQGSENDAGIVDVRDDLVVEFAPMLGQDAGILTSERKRKYLLSTFEAQERARQLLQLGPDYLFGMLFADSFTLQPSVDDGTHVAPSTSTEKTPTTTSRFHAGMPIMIIVHSRHSKTNDDGSQIQKEMKCLDQLLASMNSSDISSCSILMLSDRPNTLALLQDYISQKHPRCLAIVANHEYGVSFRYEHGPYAGVGFYQDLAMVKTGIQSLPFGGSPQIGFVGSERRSSSQLVREMMVYHHRTHQPNQFLLNTSSDIGISTCYL